MHYIRLRASDWTLSLRDTTGTKNLLLASRTIDSIEFTKIQSTPFRIIRDENEPRSIVQFKSFTAEDYKKIKQKEHGKEHKQISKIKYHQLNAGSDTMLQANSTDTVLTNGFGPVRDAKQGSVLTPSELFRVGSDYDCEMASLLSLTTEPQELSRERSDYSTSPASINELFEAADPSLNYSAPRAAQLFDTISRLEFASDSGGISTFPDDVFTQDTGTASTREVAPGTLEPGISATDGRLSYHINEPRVSRSGARANFAVLTDPCRMDYGRTPVTTRTVALDGTDDSFESLHPPQSSSIPLLPSEANTELDQGCAQEKDSLPHHLRSTAGLSWARIAPYFPRTTKSELRRRFAENMASTMQHGKDIVPPKRKRGRPPNPNGRNIWMSYFEAIDPMLADRPLSRRSCPRKL
ncbi:hypothetical protein LTR86_010933 [Recurvomyces mirabilis]|nr:hypothetical protein LTR86_010933 [Recurvomyces mirabilis]